MGREPSMQPVELDEPDPDAPPPAPSLSAADRWRRIRRRVPALVAVVLVLAGMQAVDDAQQRAARAELAAIPGVVRPVDADVRVLWTPPAGGGSVLDGITSGDALVGLLRAADGSQAVIAIDGVTGERRWTTPLAAPRPTTPQDGSLDPIGGCERVPEVSDQLLCLVSDTYRLYGDMTVELVPGTLSRLVVLDPDDGAVLADHPAPGAVAFTALPGLAVVAVPVEGGIELLGTDLASGQQRWSTTVVPPPVTPDEGEDVRASTTLLTTAAGFGVVAATRMTLLDRDGVVVRDDIDARMGFVVDPESRTLAILSMTGASLRTTFYGRGPDVVLDGRLVDVSVDDGSVPGLVLMNDEHVHAYDRDSSVPRWSVPHSMAGNALVVRGRVYLSTSSGVVAVDGRTGEELWLAPPPESRSLGALVTDGIHLLSAQQRPDVAGEVSQDDWPGVGELAAYGFDDGRELWRVDLPEDFLGVWSSGSTLVGWGPGRSAVLG